MTTRFPRGCSKILSLAPVFDVTAVGNGRLAVEQLKRLDAPRRALLDWVMPPLDGPRVCRELGKHQRNHTYVILLTSKESKEDIVTGLESRADDYLTQALQCRGAEGTIENRSAHLEPRRQTRRST